MKAQRNSLVRAVVFGVVVFGLTQTSAGALTKSVPLGQPGLSFRYLRTFGVTEQAYFADGQHLNMPEGLATDASDNLYVIEAAGSRLVKFDKNGTAVMTIGTAGLHLIDNYNHNWPKGVTLDSSGNIWVADLNRLTEYNPNGRYLQTYPPWDKNPGGSGTDNEHFNYPWSVRFDTVGRLYVADFYNHRVQVYSMSSGTPVYSTTIGVTAQQHSDNTGFNLPTWLVFDSSGRLYVLDSLNHRVQRCAFGTGWTCSTFLGVTGVPGNDLHHMNGPWGMAITAADELYIVDSYNQRVLRCDLTAACTLFAGETGVTGADNGHLWLPTGVTTDSLGNVYISDSRNQRVQVYNHSGAYQRSLGVTRVPYVADQTRLNTPSGVTVAADGSLFVSEGQGHRLVKLNSAGVQQWAAGQAGMQGTDNAHFGGEFYAGLAGNAAVSALGYVYVPDHANGRVQVLNPDGSYLRTLYGPPAHPVGCASSVAVSPVNGDIFISDDCGHAVNVFDRNESYKATLGVQGADGSDDSHFNGPRGVAVDTSGRVYVADQNNHRVQVCTWSNGYTCATLVGVAGVCGSDFGHLCGPVGVAVDALGRVYVSDTWNHRVQVFDASAAYLTTLGGSWGAGTGQLRDPGGVAVDGAGNVYVADSTNHRVQKYAPGVPGWRQVNINGFGDQQNHVVSPLEVFRDQLYAGTWNYSSGGQVWRLESSGQWQAVSVPNFGTGTFDSSIMDLAVYNNMLYAGLRNCCSGAQVWRSVDGTNWQPVTTNGFGDNGNTGVTNFVQFSGMLYAGTWNSAGAQIWRSSSGNQGTWSKVTADQFVGSYVNGLAVYNGALYASVERIADQIWQPAQVWRTTDGSNWTVAVANGFGDSGNTMIGGMAMFRGCLYVGIGNNIAGAQLWTTCDGAHWALARGGGFGDLNNQKAQMVYVFRDALYVLIINYHTGAEIWLTKDSTNWAQANADGFGDSNISTSGHTNAFATYHDHLYIGEGGYPAHGGQVWMLTASTVFLPLVLKR